MPRTRNRTGWLTRQAALRRGRAVRALGSVRCASSGDLEALARLIGDADATAIGLASAVADGRVLALGEQGAVVAAAVVGGTPVRLQLLVIDPRLIAAGIAERMRTEAAHLCAVIDQRPGPRSR